MRVHYKLLTITVLLMMVIFGFGCAPSEEMVSDFSWVIEVESGFIDVDPLKVSGNIQIAGSSTVFPLAETLAARFNDEGYGFSVTIDSIGSGAGFERFCVAGESDISNASRPIKDKEIESCRAIGREPIEIRVGTDALAVAVHPENNWAKNLTIEELVTVFTAENWSDVDGGWPDQPIERFIPGTDSGTFDYFVKEVFDDDATPLLSAATTQFSEDDNVIARGVSGSTYAVGFFGYAYAIGNAGSLRVLDIDGVTPNSASVDDGSYPLSRPLFMYSDATVIADRPQVGAFLAYVLNYAKDEVFEVGYFPSITSDSDSAKQMLTDVLRNAGALDS